MNDKQEIAFKGGLWPESGPSWTGLEGIFKWEGNGYAIVTTEDFWSSNVYFSNPSINNRGEVTYEVYGSVAESQWNSAVYKWADGDKVRIDSGVQGIRYLPRINNSGEVVFREVEDVGFNRYDRIIKGTSSAALTTVAEIVQVPSWAGPSHLGESPLINDKGDVVYTFSGCGGPCTPQTYFWKDGSTTPISLEGFEWADPTSINNQGDIFFQGQKQSGEYGTYVRKEDGLYTIADTSSASQFSGVLFNSANDRGDVTFWGNLKDDKGSGIFLSAYGDINPVVKLGDMINGKTLTAISGIGGNREELNNLGQVAFTGFLSDGTSGLFLASPAEFMVEHLTIKGVLSEWLRKAGYEELFAKTANTAEVEHILLGPHISPQWALAVKLTPSLLYALGYGTKRLRILLENDPPDLDYTQPVSPIFYDLNLVTPSEAISAELAALFNNVLNSQGRAYSYLQALQMTENRYQTALNSGDLESADMQHNIFVSFLQSLSESAGTASNAFQSLYTFLRANGFPNIEFTMDDVQSYLDLLATTGFSDEEMQIFNILGLNQLDIDAMLQMALSVDMTGTPLDFYSFLQSSANMYGDAQRNFQPTSAPVPEPCTLALLSIGLVGLVQRRRIRQFLGRAGG